MNRSNPRIDSNPRETKVTTRVPGGIDRSPIRRRPGAVGTVSSRQRSGSWVEPLRERRFPPVRRRIAGMRRPASPGSRVDAPQEERGGLAGGGRCGTMSTAVREIIFAIIDDRTVERRGEKSVGAPRPPWAATRAGRAAAWPGWSRTERHCSDSARRSAAGYAVLELQLGGDRHLCSSGLEHLGVGVGQAEGSDPGSCTASRGSGQLRPSRPNWAGKASWMNNNTSLSVVGGLHLITDH
jgi:hypothetical protein